jgi:hypothetical protein
LTEHMISEWFKEIIINHKKYFKSAYADK